MTLEGRTAVVTGGGRGIGAACARALAEAGAAVVVSARTRGEIEEVASRLVAGGHRAWAVPCDVTSEEQVDELARRAADAAGDVDVLVNNAGAASSAPVHRIELDEWNRLLAINATGTLLATRRFLPGMVERGWGRIVNVASTAGLTAAPYIGAYAASKHAVLGLTRATAAEVAAKGVTVNAVCPGYVDTAMTDATVENMVAKTGMESERARGELERMSPQGRLLAPEEVAHLVRFLCEPLSRGIHGQRIVLDGGALLV